MTFDDILERFQRKGEVRGGELLITQNDALEAILLCEQNDVAILGVEVFHISVDETTPLSDSIADCSPPASLSWREYCDVANACARAFVTQLPTMPSLYVSLTGVDRSSIISMNHQSG